MLQDLLGREGFSIGGCTLGGFCHPECSACDASVGDWSPAFWQVMIQDVFC